MHPFDQLQQIAVVITSNDREEFEGREFVCRLRPDVIPSPIAMLITRQSPGDVQSKSRHSHYEMMKAFYQFVRSHMLANKDIGGEINGYIQERYITKVGHNINEFDNRVWHFNAEAALEDPYLISGMGTASFDTLTVAKAISIYTPDAMKFGKTPKGNTGMKLGSLLEHNGIPFNKEGLHDALEDTRMTVKLDKFMHKVSPEVYYQMDLMASKHDVKKFVESNKMFSYSLYNAGKPKTGIVAPVLNNYTMCTKEEREITKGQKHRQIIWDLSYDPEAYFNMSAKKLAEMFSITAKGNGQKFTSSVDRKNRPLGNPVVIAGRHKQPIFMPAHLTPTNLWPDEDKTVLRKRKPNNGLKTLNQKELAIRAQKLADNPKFQAKLTKALAIATKEQSQKYEQGQHFQEWLYESFPDKKMKDWFTHFHHSEWHQKMTLLDGFPKRFEKEIEKEPTLKRFYYHGVRIVLAAAPDEVIKKSVKWRRIQKRFDEGMAKAQLTSNTYERPGMAEPRVTLPRARLQMERIRDEFMESDNPGVWKRYGFKNKVEAVRFAREWVSWYNEKIQQAQNLQNLLVSSANENKNNKTPVKKRSSKGISPK